MAYKHKYELLIGDPLSEIEVPITIPINIDDKLNQATILTQHHITFDIKNTNKESNNLATINIYNANSTLSNKLSTFNSKNLVVEIKAGYEDQEVLRLFSGTISKVEEKFEGETKITKITVKDGNVNTKETRSVKTYPKGTQIDDIFEDMFNEMGLQVAVGKWAKLGPLSKLKSPYMASGSIVSNINRLADRNKFKFSIQEGKATLMPIDGKVLENVIVVSNLKSNGTLIGAPTFFSETGDNKTNDTEANKKSYKFKSTLNGGIKPESNVLLESVDYPEGVVLKVVSSRHVGSFEGNDWYTEAVGVELESNFVVSGLPYERN